MPDSDATRELTVPSDAQGIWEFRAEIYANDATGVRLNNLEVGDVVKIRSISGWCTFSDKNRGSIAKEIFSLAAPFVGGALPSAAKTALDSLKKDAGFMSSEPTKGKARNGWGRVQGKDEYAIKEGGIIVCMPGAGGPIASRDETRPHKDAEEHGRLPKYFPKGIQGSAFFPCRGDGGQREMEAPEDGAAWILAFDHEYKDNHGVYEVDFSVIRQ